MRERGLFYLKARAVVVEVKSSKVADVVGFFSESFDSIDVGDISNNRHRIYEIKIRFFFVRYSIFRFNQN